MGNPVNFTDPSGYLLSGWSLKHIGSMGRDKIDHVKHWGQDRVNSITGTAYIIGGLVLIGTGNPLGVGLVKYGVDTINKEKIRTFSFQMSIPIDFSGDVGVSSSNAINYQSQAIVDDLTYSTDITDNSKYKNAAVSESFSWATDSKGELQLYSPNQGVGNSNTIVIVKYISSDDSINYDGLDPRLQSAYDYQQIVDSDPGLEDGLSDLAMFLPVGRAGGVVGEGGLNLYKWGHYTSNRATNWKTADRMLFLPNKGTPKLNWKQNSSALRYEMRKGNLIYDSYRYDNGYQILDGYNSFIHAERSLLESRGWRYNTTTGAYHP
jgi:hypothetical protein